MRVTFENIRTLSLPTTLYGIGARQLREMTAERLRNGHVRVRSADSTPALTPSRFRAEALYTTREEARAHLLKQLEGNRAALLAELAIVEARLEAL